MGTVGQRGRGAAARVGGILVRAEFDFVTTTMPPGLSVIEASAGTGKTYSISHLVPRFLLDGTARNLGEILLVTFTNDAAGELAERVRRVLEKLAAPPIADEATSDAGLHRLRREFGGRIPGVIGRALLDLDRLGVSTIHSFCQRVLQTEGTLCGLPVVPELTPDVDAIAERALADLWETRVAGSASLSAIATARGWSVGDELWFVRAAFPLADAEFVPAPREFSASLAEVEDLPAMFTEAVCAEFESIVGELTAPTVKTPSEAVRRATLDVLRGAGKFGDPGFLAAVQRVAEAEGWFNGTKQKPLKARAKACQAVRIAADALGLLDRIRWDFRHDYLPAIRETVAGTLRANREIGYDGIIDSLSEALRGPLGPTLAARLRDRYKVGLIDESQDTDARQFDIFRRIFVGSDGEAALPDHRLILIGDPKQAIYAFRGADVNTYLGARDGAGENVFALTKTFRAPEEFVRATNAFFRRPGSFLKAGLDFPEASSGLSGDWRLVAADGEPDGPRIEAWIAPDDAGDEYSTAGRRLARIGGAVATEIVRLLNGPARLERTLGDGGVETRDVAPGDFAVLTNSHREAAAMRDELRGRRVPAIRAGADDIMASDEAAELLTLLRALHEPRREGLRLAAMGTRLLGLHHGEIADLREDASGEDEWLERFLAWQSTWHRAGISAALAGMDAERGITLRLARLERGERRITNLRQLTDLLQAAGLELGPRPAHLVRWLTREIGRAGAGRPADERQQQLESDAAAVQIVTMHAAKGLEYPLVFCPFLWSAPSGGGGVKKLARASEPPLLVDLAQPTDDAIAAAIERDALEDRLRLAYVALTRAQVKAWIYGGELAGTRSRPGPSALDWLLRSEAQPDLADWRVEAATGGRGTRHAAGLAAIIRDGGGRDVIAGVAPPAVDSVPWDAPKAAGELELRALDFPSIPSAWQLTSFSGLTREQHPHGGAPSILTEPPAVAGDERPANSFFDAPGGTMVGTAIHDWIERWDFGELPRDAVGPHLKKYPLPARWPDAKLTLAQSVEGMLIDLGRAVLPGLDLSVAEACPRPEASEWHFQLPLKGSLSSAALAEIFARHGEKEYAGILAALPVEELHGYLHGFLDRLARSGDAWGVVDWKTNRLGPTLASYGPDQLRACAMRSHYLLQTHLYLIALRRYLAGRATVAGAWLVFLRAIDAGSSEGILHVHPSEALLDELDGLFEKSATAAAP